MNRRTKMLIDQARTRGSAVASATAKRPTLSAIQADTSVREVIDCDVFTIRDVQARLHCAKDKALRLAKKEPGVVKIGKSYLIPRSVFERLIRRSLIAA